MAILGVQPKELAALKALFARRQKPYLVQRAERDGQRHPWSTVKYRLTDDLIVRHLLADRIPGSTPLWIGVFAFETTQYVAIDVDLKADGFADRCQLVESVLYRLGIPRDHWLIQPSPSGGRHYFLFSRDSIPTDEIRPAFAQAGLIHRPGLHEIYPSQSHGLRLPFGWVPSIPHDPSAWVGFIRAYKAGTFPRVNWDRCKKRAAAYAVSRPAIVKPANPPPRSDSAPVKPVSHRRRIARDRQRGSCAASTTAVALRKVTADQLLKRGIQAPGERRSLTKSIAWHLIFVRKMSLQGAGDMLIEWVNRTGRHTSTDVKFDLQHGTSRVAQDTRSIVAYYARLAPTQSTGGKAKFAPSEISYLIELVQNGPLGDRPTRLRFALDFLNFAKNSQRPVAEGWECCPAVRGIIRKWHGCSGMRYKPLIQWALESGLIKMTREKRQSNGRGRARTYQVRVPQVASEDVMLSYSAALRYVSDQGQRIPDRRRSRHDSSPGRPENDTYGFSNVSLKGRNVCSQATDRATESIDQVTRVMNSPFQPINQWIHPAQGPTADRLPPKGTLNAARTTKLCDARRCRDGQHTSHRPPVSQRQYPSSPHGRLAARSAQRAHESDAISRLLHSPVGQRYRHLERSSGYATGLGASALRAPPPVKDQGGTPRPDGLPEPADFKSIANALAQLKATAAAVYPMSIVEQWPIWAAIEAMVRDPYYPPLQRRLLLTNPTTLNYQQVCQRNRLILEWRRQNE